MRNLVLIIAHVFDCYSKHRKRVHFVLERVNVSFPCCRYTTPLLISITKRVKSKAACWSCCIKQHRRDTPHMISSEKICSQIDLWGNNICLPFLPSLSFNQAPVGGQTSVLLIKDFLEFLHIEIYTLALLCMLYVLL